MNQASAQISPGPLAKSHEKLDGPLHCLKCHGGKGESMDGNCLTCHQPIARLQSLDRGLHGSVKTTKCASCHPEHAGRDFHLITWDSGTPEAFAHARTGWPLTGKHHDTVCRDCHKPAFQKSAVIAGLAPERQAATWLGLDRDCANCHQDPHGGALDRNCAGCHATDTFKGAKVFDHAGSAFPLTGKHGTVECAKCHKVAEGAPIPAGLKAALPTFKPVAHAECSNCHADPHKGQLGERCASCHVTDSFHKIDTAKFDHDRTRFPLRGRHESVECAKCHDPKLGGSARPEFSKCTSCHRDAHNGQATLAGQVVDCASCHTVQGYKPSTYTAESHRAARFPLAGKHLTVACESCHRKSAVAGAGSPWGTAGVVMRPGFKACGDCHEPAHGRQLAARPDRGACESCHKVDGWKPSTFGATQHAALKLALTGRHADIACAACHGPDRKGLPPLPGKEVLGPAGVMVALSGAACADCHFDPHRGRFRTGDHKTLEDCAQCHGTAGFRPSTIDVAAHDRFSFKLDGAHQAVPCAACHDELRRPKGKSSLLLVDTPHAALLFDQTRRECRECHDTPHGNQFARRPDAGNCASCHGTDTFKPATRFDHNRDAAFSLKGAHEKVPCARCHTTRADDKGRRIVIYRPVETKCESCHGTVEHAR